jgi:hypothetical protein
MKVKDVGKAIGEFELNNISKYLRATAGILLRGYLSLAKLCSTLLILGVLYCAVHIGYIVHNEGASVSLVFLNSMVSLSDLTATVGVMLLSFCFLKYSILKIKI